MSGDLQRRHAADGRPHGGRGLRRRRLPHRVGLRRRHAARAAGTATTGSASSSRSPSPPIAMPVQMGVGDSLARWVYNNQPAKFAAIELVPDRPSSDVPETLLGHLNADGTVSGGHPDPRPGVVPVRPQRPARPPSSRGSTRCPPTSGRPPRRSTPSTWRGTSWSASARCCSCCRCGTGLSWIFRRDMPKSRWFLRIAAAAGVLAVITMEAGWVVSEVGRQPWIVYKQMKVEDAATANTGVWITFVGVVRPLRRPRRHHDPGAAQHEPAVPRRRPGADDADVPYGPSEPIADRARARQEVPLDEHRRRRRPLRRRSPPTPSSAAPTSAPASGTSSPAAPSAASGPARSSTTRSPRCGRPTTSG